MRNAWNAFFGTLTSIFKATEYLSKWAEEEAGVLYDDAAATRAAKRKQADALIES